MVERGTVVKKVDIPRSPVRFRNGGFAFIGTRSLTVISGPCTRLEFVFCMFIGKFAQRSNLTKTKMIHEPKEFFELLYSSKFEVCDARLVNDDVVEVQYRNVEEFAEQNNKVNVIIAAFTTAYARLKLYDLLDLLQERDLYYDTDSVIYVDEPGKPEPPLGNYLGDLTDELNGDYITSFVSGGPKNYAYRTKKGKTDTKIRGITLDYAASGKLNHDVVRASLSIYIRIAPRKQK